MHWLLTLKSNFLPLNSKSLPFSANIISLKTFMPTTKIKTSIKIPMLLTMLNRISLWFLDYMLLPIPMMLLWISISSFSKIASEKTRMVTRDGHILNTFYQKSWSPIKLEPLRSHRKETFEWKSQIFSSTSISILILSKAIIEVPIVF